MSTKSLNQFDRVAPFYDLLARAVYGNSIRKAQTSFLNQIAPGSTVLVIGGGTGWWLPELLQTVPDIRICFVEASGKMLAAARKVNDSRVEFIHGTVNDISRERSFDVVITHFFLDLFREPDLRALVGRIGRHLTPGGRWLIADFVNRTWWHAALLKVMYFFFSLTCKVRIRSLPSWREVLEQECLRCKNERKFYGNFISSCSFELQSSR